MGKEKGRNMTEPYFPRWLIVYIYIYGVLNIFISIPWLFTAPLGLIILLPLMMFISGVSILFKKWWGIIPILILAIFFSAFIVVILYFGIGYYGAYAIFTIYSLILLIQWITFVIYWKYIVRRKNIAT